MGRKPTKCPKKCPKHLLSLKPIQQPVHYPRELSVSFCPPTLNQHPVYPTFNKDRKHYTSSFCLHDEKNKYEVNDALYKAEHDRFCQEQQEGKSKLFEPKPRSKNQYCHVCKDHYEDYLQHVSSGPHKDSISKNKFSTYIGNLIEKEFPFKREKELTILSCPSEDLILEKEMSTVSLPNPAQINVETINEPRFSEHFKKFDKGVFGFYYNEKSSKDNCREKEGSPLQNEAKGHFSSLDEKRVLLSAKLREPIILNTFLIPQ